MDWVLIILMFALLLFLLCIYVSYVARRAFDMGYRKALKDSSMHGVYYEGHF